RRSSGQVQMSLLRANSRLDDDFQFGDVPVVNRFHDRISVTDIQLCAVPYEDGHRFVGTAPDRLEQWAEVRIFPVGVSAAFEEELEQIVAMAPYRPVEQRHA